MVASVFKLYNKIKYLLLCSLMTLAFALALAWSAPLRAYDVAPGFEKLPTGAKVLILPSDIELFELGVGGVVEPKADWTRDAQRFFRDAMLAKKKSLGAAVIEADEKQVDDIAEFNSLHAAVADAIVRHHFGPRQFRLPTKEGYMNWSMGEAVRVVKEKSGADYALFTFIRDSYASAGRIASGVALTVVGALFGVVMVPTGGVQVGYASLVDLNTGQVVWFNQLRSATGDLREPEKAARSLDALLHAFPSAK